VQACKTLAVVHDVGTSNCGELLNQLAKVWWKSNVQTCFIIESSTCSSFVEIARLGVSTKREHTQNTQAKGVVRYPTIMLLNDHWISQLQGAWAIGFSKKKKNLLFFSASFSARGVDRESLLDCYRYTLSNEKTKLFRRP